MMAENRKKPFWRKWWVWVVAIVIIGGVATAGKDNGTTTSDPEKKEEPAKATEPAKQEPPKNEPTMSMAEFEQIKTGMTLEQVTQIVGSEGEVLSEAGSGEFQIVMRKWEGEGSIGANSNLTFQNGKVSAKAQFGLE